ncbi:Cryptochrome-1 [Amphibalanus amphitrite]|uniref:Cryptochrome-1 n=1 Tax=Amphibalanus amphitrite TaxID=1232801 RepID=A0A6A4W5L9_AMPAM|nr:Cryptochrome-1 [Amphibalanus amphitrite]
MTRPNTVCTGFRKGLRLHDNASLLEGVAGSTTFRCIYILDPWFAGSSNVGINKWRFLLQCLEDLDKSLQRLNSRLFVIRGQPADVLPSLFKKWNITCLSFGEDPEPFGKVRDQNVRKMALEHNVEVISRTCHTLYDVDTVIERAGGRSPLTYKQFQTVLLSMPPPPAPLHALNHDRFDTESAHKGVWHGGETEALVRLERHMERKAWIASFGRPKMTPQSLKASVTGVSPYLRFGALSPRLFYRDLAYLYRKVSSLSPRLFYRDLAYLYRKVSSLSPRLFYRDLAYLYRKSVSWLFYRDLAYLYRKVSSLSPRLFYRDLAYLYRKIKHADPPLSLHGQLLWREFFYVAATNNPNFDRMVGNPICVQIPWDKNPKALAKWASGQTGFPWIDAIMTQLRQEGWIHHLARHAVACFLTRGYLWLSWEEGMQVFEELLLDADWSVNAGTWMWLSCSSFFQQFFHCYSPVRFGRKVDPEGDYIRTYLPVLKGMPSRYIHEPWLAPKSVQKAAKCIVGEDYPLPMVCHTDASRINVERMRQIYSRLLGYKGHKGELMGERRAARRVLLLPCKGKITMLAC